MECNYPSYGIDRLSVFSRPSRFDTTSCLWEQFYSVVEDDIMRRGFLLEPTKRGSYKSSNVFRGERSSSESSSASSLDRRSSESSSSGNGDVSVPSDVPPFVPRCRSTSSNESDYPPLLSSCDRPVDAIVGDVTRQSIESMSRGFSRPRCITDPVNILRGEEREDPGCISRFMDLYVWCVDDENDILDYPTEQIESMYWTNDVVYRPFDSKFVSLIYRDVMYYAERCENYLNTISGMSQNEKMKAIEDNTFPKRNCLWRALALQNSNPSKYAVVFGSLGFRQGNGKIFWEYG